MIRLAALSLMLGVAACGMPALNVKFVEPNISQFKARGNRVVVGEGSLVSDVLAIEVMKNGKFQIAGHALPKEAGPSKVALSELDSAPRPNSPVPRSNLLAAADSAPAAASARAEASEPASPSPEAAPQGGNFDYIFSVNTSTKLYAPSSNSYPATYSFSVTAISGEIIYIKALSGGDLKTELSATLGEVAGLLL
ncbi:MAG: hypothetical protein ABI488_16505 [Polyangiaceae bacterium]